MKVSISKINNPLTELLAKKYFLKIFVNDIDSQNGLTKKGEGYTKRKPHPCLQLYFQALHVQKI